MPVITELEREGRAVEIDAAQSPEQVRQRGFGRGGGPYNYSCVRPTGGRPPPLQVLKQKTTTVPVSWQQAMHACLQITCVVDSMHTPEHNPPCC
jgi:hypothetical protein